jgi:RND family efflux transporter MFP subunit
MFSMMTETEKADLSSLRISRNEPVPSARKNISWKMISAAILVVVLVTGYFLLRDGLSPAVEVELGSATLTYPSQSSAVLTASGYVVAQQKASVASKGTGRLEYLRVEEGDVVKKGQIIARLEDEDVVAALAQSKANLELAQADLADAEQSLDRQKALYAAGLTSKAEMDAAEARHARVRASIKSALAAISAAEVAVENTRIRAPFDGTVLTKDADVGEVVAPFASSSSSRGAVVTMADMSSLLVEADVSESNITRVKAGQPCEIVLDAYPDHRYEGLVHKIVPTADRAKATVLTKVRFTNRDDRVLPEMSAKVTFLSGRLDLSREGSNTPRLTIPSTGLVTRDGREMVFRAEQGVVTEVPVKTGQRIGNRIEIVEGLMQGDSIVLRPLPGLSTGSKIKSKS